MKYMSQCLQAYKVMVWFFRALYKSCASMKEKISYLIVLNGEVVAMVNGAINDALHKVKDSINSEVLKDLYKSKAS